MEKGPTRAVEAVFNQGKALVGTFSVIVKLPMSRRYVTSSIRAKLRGRSPDPGSPWQRQQGAVTAGKISAVVPKWFPGPAPHLPSCEPENSGNTPSKYFGGYAILHTSNINMKGSPFLEAKFFI